MQWQYGFNPNAPYNTEIYPDPMQYDPKLRNANCDIPYNANSGRVVSSNEENSFILMFQLILGFVMMIYIIKFFFLIIAPLVPISVITYEVINLLLVKKSTIVYGASFLAAYLAYRWYNSYLILFPSFTVQLMYLIVFYTANIGITFLLLEFYPNNRVLLGLVEEFDMVSAVLKPYLVSFFFCL